MIASWVVYLLCSLTSSLCAVLMLLKYQATRTRLLLWSFFCFLGMAINNTLLLIDRVFLPTEVDLTFWRTMPAFLGLGALVWAFIWESTK